MVDMEAFPRDQKPKSELCAMCGEAPPTKVIWDPNKFPGGSDDDTWDVCSDCKKFIEEGMITGYKLVLHTLVEGEHDKESANG